MEAGEVHAEQTAVRWDTPSLAESGKRSRRGELEPSVEKQEESALQSSSGRAWTEVGRAGGYCPRSTRGSVCTSYVYCSLHSGSTRHSDLQG